MIPRNRKKIWTQDCDSEAPNEALALMYMSDGRGLTKIILHIRKSIYIDSP